MAPTLSERVDVLEAEVDELKQAAEAKSETDQDDVGAELERLKRRLGGILGVSMEDDPVGEPAPEQDETGAENETEEVAPGGEDAEPESDDTETEEAEA